MMIYVVTEEPYHENSTVVGVFTHFDEAEQFIKSRPTSPPVNSSEEPEVWELTEWDVTHQGQKRKWSLFRPMGDFVDGKVQRGDWTLELNTEDET